jgi:hypothetical protein
MTRAVVGIVSSVVALVILGVLYAASREPEPSVNHDGCVVEGPPTLQAMLASFCGGAGTITHVKWSRTPEMARVRLTVAPRYVAAFQRVDMTVVKENARAFVLATSKAMQSESELGYYSPSGLPLLVCASTATLTECR